jgi:dienelactone hydrolase
MNMSLLLLLVAQTTTTPSFDYDTARPLDVRETARREQGGALLRDITYVELSGGPSERPEGSPPKAGPRARARGGTGGAPRASRNAATLVTPAAARSTPAPAVLFVHWYGPPRPTSNRTQFVPDAVALAKHGVTSLLIDTPWSVPEYFKQRRRAEDFTRSVQQVRDLRRALDVLLAQPGIDPKRVAFVGHDFGAMYGAVAAAHDRRITHFVFMAGTASFSDWFLYGPPKLEGAERERFVSELAPLDPTTWVAKLQGPLLMQFADTDEHVPAARRELLVRAAPKGADVRLYKAGHELNDDATRDRLAWLEQQLTSR